MMALSPDKVRMIESLIAVGERDSTISRMLNTSRMTIREIRRGVYQRRTSIPRPKPRTRDTPMHYRTGQHERCPTCGGLAILPCQLCEVRRFKARNGQWTGGDAEFQPR